MQCTCDTWKLAQVFKAHCSYANNSDLQMAEHSHALSITCTSSCRISASLNSDPGAVKRQIVDRCMPLHVRQGVETDAPKVIQQGELVLCRHSVAGVHVDARAWGIIREPPMLDILSDPRQRGIRRGFDFAGGSFHVHHLHRPTREFCLLKRTPACCESHTCACHSHQGHLSMCAVFTVTPMVPLVDSASLGEGSDDKHPRQQQFAPQCQ